MADSTKPPDNPFAPYQSPDGGPLDHRRLSHLLRRAAIAPAPALVARFADQSPARIIDALLDYDPADDRPYSDLLAGVTGAISPIYAPDTAQEWWLLRMLDTPRPAQERIALFWHNHFATSTGKVRFAALVSRQIDLFRRSGLESFRNLLVAVGRDPAMLVWLDGSKNKRGRPNENYAREVMELFSLGIGHYTEKDVRELARAFTGWQVLDETAHFFPSAFDDGPKTFLGQTGKFDSESAVDVLLKQPSAPRFIARKLLKEFVHPTPEDAQVSHVASRLLAHQWRIKPVVKEILASRLFFSDYAYRSKIKSPCELVIGSMLALGASRDARFARNAMSSMGQALLAPPSVKGWDGEQTWINASTVIRRYNFAQDLSARLPRPKLLPALESQAARSAPAIVDHLGRILLDGQIDPATRATLIKYLDSDHRGKSSPFKLTPESFDAKVRTVLHLMMSTPEYQLA